MYKIIIVNPSMTRGVEIIQIISREKQTCLCEHEMTNIMVLSQERISYSIFTELQYCLFDNTNGKLTTLSTFKIRNWLGSESDVPSIRSYSFMSLTLLLCF